MARCRTWEGALMPRTIPTICSWFVLCVGAYAQHAAQPWWQTETAVAKDSQLTLKQKAWWPRAQALKEGERFELDLNRDGKADTIVTRVDGDIVEAIDDTGHASDIWNHVSTTYVVSYDGTGLVDRMVSYIDGHHEGHASEVEIRYFQNGYLRYGWFANRFGGDAADIFALKRWQYAGNDHGSKFRGNAQIYLNKYDPATDSWQPLSECPFSFWDLDHDGRTDVTLRVSVAPRGSLHGPDTDYANNYDYMWAKDATPQTKMGALNMRLSFNIDARPRTDALDKPHSNFSFTMTGEAPYMYANARDFNASRRAPQTTVHMSWSLRWNAAMLYPANATGFSWDEARTNFRWEGQFWIYERAYLSNTGSPTERWNMRREYTSTPSRLRQIYFSPVDQRFHLRGAREAWLEVGHIISDEKNLEFRWWDTDGDGLLDTVEVFRGNATEPARVAHFDPHASAVNLDVETLSRLYNSKMIPEAIRRDEVLNKAMRLLISDDTATKYEAAAGQADSQERRRYCLDIARELLYLRVRDLINNEEQSDLYPSANADTKRFRDPVTGTPESGYTLGDSLRYWNRVRLLHEMDAAYASGEFDKVEALLAHVDRSGKVKSYAR
jgi:hypothetical protein